MRSVDDFLRGSIVSCSQRVKKERVAVGSDEQPRDILLFAYVDGELDEEQRCLVEALLARDPDARQRVEQIRELNALLKAAYDVNGEEKT
jgi:anti-sigma factor RsiW